MEETIGNTPSEMLNLLVDGELDTSQEVALYASLTESDELRNEMREILAIRESIRKDMEAFTPPPGIRKSVLAAVGLTPGGIINAPMTQVAVQTGFWGGFWARVLVPVATALVATLITSLLFLNFYRSGNEAVPSLRSLNNIPVVTSSENTQSDKSSQNMSLNIQKSVQGHKNHSAVIADNPAVFDNAVNTNNELKSTGEQSLIQVEMASSGNDVYKNVNLNQNKLIRNDIPASVLNPNRFSSINSNKLSGLGITMSFRGISARSFPNVDLPSQFDPLISNAGIGAYINLVDGLDVGLEAGQENYGMIYIDREAGDIVYKNPIIFWFGIGLKGKITRHVDFLAGAKPFIQAFAGGSNVGPTVKLSGGLEYSWSNGLGFLLGLEGSSLFYNEQGRWYSTEKLGFTYGMLYSF